MRGDVTHGGGLVTANSKYGNPRLHWYIEKEYGQSIGGDYKNHYHTPESDGGLYLLPKDDTGRIMSANNMIDSVNGK